MKRKFQIQKDNPTIELRRILTKRDVNDLFLGFEELYFVTYDCTLHTLRTLMAENDLKKVVGVVGNEMSEKLKKEISKKHLLEILELTDMVRTGELQLYLPEQKKRPIHDKFYLLKKEGRVRVVMGSSNLSESGLYGRGQINSIVITDYYTDTKKAANPKPYLDYFEDVKAECKLFMGDLLDYLERDDDKDQQKETIHLWLKTPDEDAQGSIQDAYFVDLAEQAFVFTDDEGSADEYIIIPEPTIDLGKEEREKLFPASKFQKVENNKLKGLKIHLRETLLKNCNFPIMRVDHNNKDVSLYIDSPEKIARIAEPTSPETVNQYLANLEAYCETVELGETTTKEKREEAKAAIFECLLYFFTAPYFHNIQRFRRSKLGNIDKRGPFYLVIYGRTKNGKSTFVNYMMKLITGKTFNPLPSSEFTKKKIENIMPFGTVFPIVFDDVPKDRVKRCELLLKGYWETEWKGTKPIPQVIITTNDRNFYDWFHSRAKIVDFDTYFNPDNKTQETLNNIVESPNDIFQYFSYLFLRKLNIEHIPDYHKDLLSISRETFDDLYKFAERKKPSYVLDMPFEQKYDHSLQEFKDLIDKRKQAKVVENEDYFLLEFSEDVEGWEVGRYKDMLPSNMQGEKFGRKIKVNNKNGFRHWYYNGYSPSLWKKMLRAVGFSKN